jgi:hypothetical protein
LFTAKTEYTVFAATPVSVILSFSRVFGERPHRKSCVCLSRSRASVRLFFSARLRLQSLPCQTATRMLRYFMQFRRNPFSFDTAFLFAYPQFLQKANRFYYTSSSVSSDFCAFFNFFRFLDFFRKVLIPHQTFLTRRRTAFRRVTLAAGYVFDGAYSRSMLEKTMRRQKRRRQGKEIPLKIQYNNSEHKRTIVLKKREIFFRTVKFTEKYAGKPSPFYNIRIGK